MRLKERASGSIWGTRMGAASPNTRMQKRTRFVSIMVGGAVYASFNDNTVWSLLHLYATAPMRTRGWGSARRGMGVCAQGDVGVWASARRGMWGSWRGGSARGANI